MGDKFEGIVIIIVSLATYFFLIKGVIPFLESIADRAQCVPNLLIISNKNKKSIVFVTVILYGLLMVTRLLKDDSKDNSDHK